MDKVTLELDPSLAARLEAFAASTGRSPPRLIADLLDAASALVGQATLTPRRPAAPPARFEWHARSLGALVDITDKQALQDILDAPLIEAATRHGRSE